MRTILKYSFPFLLILFVWNCSQNIAGKGGGTEAGNTISGIVQDSSGILSNVKVTLFPVNYNPKKDSFNLIAATTNDSGKFSLEGVEPGLYNILAKTENNTNQTIVKNVKIEEGSDVIQKDLILTPTATVSIAVDSMISEGEGYVYIPGTDLIIHVDSVIVKDGFIIINNVPAIAYSEIIFVSENDFSVNILQDTVNVKPEEEILVGRYSNWKYHKKVYLNTSPSGAGVYSDVYHFPVLLRLHSGNFNFEEASNSGDDIRFTKFNDKSLSYEIENWSYSNKSAEIWVFVDTVFGNDENQFINIFWGNVEALSESQGKEVFSDVNNFIGAWHFNGNVLDATLNKLHGSANGLVDSLGIISGAYFFAGAGENVNIGKHEVLNFGTNIDFSMSLWIKRNFLMPDTNPQIDPPLISNKRWRVSGDGIDTGFALHVEKETFRINGGDGNRRVDLDGITDVNDGQWHYCAVTADRDGRLKIYVDGEIDGVKMMDHVSTFNSNLDLVIGNGATKESPYPYMGLMDEVRISKGVRSEAWIKLSYENMKENSLFIK